MGVNGRGGGRPAPAVRAVLAVLLLSVTACAGGGGGGGDASLGAPGPPTSVAPPPPTAAGPTTATVPAPPGCDVPPTLAPDPARPRYVMTLDIQPSAATVDGSIDVRFTPDFETDRVVFRVWPNGPRQLSFGSRLEIAEPVEIDGRPAATSFDDPTTFVARPGGTLRPGQAVDVRLRFHLKLPQPARDRISAERDSVRMGSFFPILEYEPGRGWTSDPPTVRFAEASTAPAADFDLTVTTPPGYDVIASGTSDRPGHWTAVGMRDISVAVGHFTFATGTANAPHPVDVLVGVDADVPDSPQPYLDRVVDVLEANSRRFGPYPWPTFAVSVTPGISTGIEYPGHILHGPGTADDILTHEVSHQWFYALVGNNQARDPWLDEALTTWAEARYEGTLEQFRETAIPASVRRRVTEPMTFWDQSSAFWLGAYVQGAQALAALGPVERVDCALRIYAAQNAYRIARPPDLLAALVKVFPDAATTLARFGIEA